MLGHLRRIADASLGFLRENVPRNWGVFWDQVPDNLDDNLASSSRAIFGS
jgi:hypothetical protein